MKNQTFIFMAMSTAIINTFTLMASKKVVQLLFQKEQNLLLIQIDMIRMITMKKLNT